MMFLDQVTEPSVKNSNLIPFKTLLSLMEDADNEEFG